jgi:hypothetical protein
VQIRGGSGSNWNIGEEIEKSAIWWRMDRMDSEGEGRGDGYFADNKKRLNDFTDVDSGLRASIFLCCLDRISAKMTLNGGRKWMSSTIAAVDQDRA